MMILGSSYKIMQCNIILIHFALKTSLKLNYIIIGSMKNSKIFILQLNHATEISFLTNVHNNLQQTTFYMIIYSIILINKQVLISKYINIIKMILNLLMQILTNITPYMEQQIQNSITLQIIQEKNLLTQLSFYMVLIKSILMIIGFLQVRKKTKNTLSTINLVGK